MTSREKFKIQTGAPLVVTLDKAQPQEVKSNFTDDGKEYRYEVSRDGKPGFVYLPSAARNALIRTQVSDGDDIQILRIGTNGHTQWRIDPISDSREPEPAPVPARQQQAQPVAPQAAPQTHPVQDRMKRLLKAAAYALRDAHTELRAEGFDLETPNWEDVRCIAIHWNISAERAK